MKRRHVKKHNLKLAKRIEKLLVDNGYTSEKGFTIKRHLMINGFEYSIILRSKFGGVSCLFPSLSVHRSNEKVLTDAKSDLEATGRESNNGKTTMGNTNSIGRKAV